MRVLVTGASGFVGPHLIEELHQHGLEVIPSTPRGIPFIEVGNVKMPSIECDIDCESDVENLVKSSCPDAVVHLAAISHVGQAEKERESLVAINVLGTHNLCRFLHRSTRSVNFLYVSTSLVYGQSVLGSHVYGETSPTNPETPYGCSKLSGEYVVRSYASDSFKPYIVRPFNHIGPGQSPQFVCSGLAAKIAQAPDGGTIEVGNLGAFRDFTDVRDIVRAYRMILTQTPGQRLFVLGSGKLVKIQDVFDWFVKRSHKSLTFQSIKALERAIDPPKLSAHTGLARTVLNWEPKISLEKSWEDIYSEALKKHGQKI